MFGAPAEPAETPATDDLFGAPAEEPAAEPEAADDMFGAPAEEPADSGTDDLFGPASSDEDDLFGAPVEEAAPPADEQPAPADEPEEDDLFGGFGAILEQPGGLSSLSLRHWVDNTGRYTVDARLLGVVDGHVKLLKANGRTTTVAFSRLCDEDLAFVNRQAAAQQAEKLAQTAQR
jgi:hypothetical protein